MRHGSDQMSVWMPGHVLWISGILLVVLVIAVLLGVFFSRREFTVHWLDPGERMARGLNTARVHSLDQQARRSSSEESIGEDTVFVLPDISGYTRFMTLNRFALGHAQYIILELLNAITSAAGSRLQLCKLEGDAALLMAPVRTVSGEAVSQAIMDIFAGFDRARRTLAHSNLCPCKACQHIRGLDLKIFVHRGEASYFQLGDMIDVFGEEVIVLHRLMKNRVNLRRYVLVSEAAGRFMKLPAGFVPTETKVEIEGIGLVEASVYEVDPSSLDGIAGTTVEPQTTRWGQTWRKLGANWKTISSRFFRRTPGQRIGAETLGAQGHNQR